MEKKLLSSLVAGLVAFVMLLPDMAGAQPAPFSQDPFTDVAETHANYEAIEYLRTNNVLKGYLDGMFRPDNRITRAEFTVLLTNPFIIDPERPNDCLAAIESGSGSEAALNALLFPDVPADHWAAPAVCFAKEMQLIHGYPDGKFRPNDPINFAEAAKITANVFALAIAEEPEGERRWYVPYVARLAEERAIPLSIESHAQILTRAEMAEIVYRLKAGKDRESSRTAAELD